MLLPIVPFIVLFIYVQRTPTDSTIYQLGLHLGPKRVFIYRRHYPLFVKIVGINVKVIRLIGRKLSHIFSDILW